MKKGFTLIELLVVVLIIGILSAVALPQYQKAVAKARFAAEVIPAVDAFKKGSDAFLLENGGYPSNNYVNFEDYSTLEMPDLSKSKFFEFDSANCSSWGCQFLLSHTANEPTYQISVVKPARKGDFNEEVENEWVMRCYTVYTDSGRSFCKSLEGQGWKTLEHEF